MTCDDCRRHLQARLDGESAAEDDLRAHLASCADCRALGTAAHRLRVGLLATAVPTPPAGLADRIVAGVLADHRRRRRRRALVVAAAGLAVAASVVLALVLKDRLAPSPSGFVQNDPGPPANPPAAPPPSLNENMEQATSAVASLARRTADETMSNGQLLVPSVPLDMPPEEVLGPPLESPAQSLREAGQGVVTGLEPVTTSARRALDMFLRDMPPMGPETKSGL